MSNDKIVLVFLTVEEVAQLLKVSTKSVRRWSQQDPSMPATRIGGTVRFDKERLLRWLQSKTQGFGRPRAHRTAHAAPEQELTA